MSKITNENIMIFLLALLQMFLLMGCSSQGNEEFCQQMMRHDIEGEESIPITGFLKKDYAVRIQCAFVDKTADDMDFIKLTPRASEIKKKRNGVPTSELLNATIPFGWVSMNITVSKKKINISPYIGSINFDYPLRELIIASDDTTLCPQGKLSWKIVKDIGTIVPIHYINTCSLTIKSKKDFTPIINILGFNYAFSYDSRIILGSSGSKLPGSSYRFILENVSDSLRLLYQENECDTKSLLASLFHKEVLTNITANTLDEEYILVFEPLVEETMCEQSTVAQEELNLSDYDTMILGIIFALVTVILCGIIIYFISKKKKKKKSYKKLEKEKDDLVEMKNNKIIPLLSQSKTMEDVRNEFLWDAASSGEISTVKAAIEGQADLNYTNSLSGRTPLYAACQGGHLDIVQELLEAGANKDMQDSNDRSPLHAACQGGYLSIVQKLLEAGANKDTKDNNDETPQDIAIKNGHKDIEELLNQGAIV